MSEKKEQVKELFEKREFKFPKDRQGTITGKRVEQNQAVPPVPPRQDPRKPSVRVEPMDERPAQQPQRSAEVEKNPAYFDITLPSNFHFYPFKNLSVRTFKAPDQAKCIRAAKEGRFRHLVEAISGTLQPGVSAHDLTHQDFYFVMYWHRMNSFNKSPYINKTICENQDHMAEVIAGKKDEKTLEISTIITRSTLKEVPLDIEKIVVPEELAQKYNLGVLRIRDMVEIEEMEEEQDFANIEFLADIACYLEPRNDAEKSIKERIKLVSEMTPDEIDDLQAYIQSVNNYGVTEAVQVKCKECGAEKETKVTIDALAFLPTPR